MWSHCFSSLLVGLPAQNKTEKTLALIDKGFLIDRYRKLASHERYNLVLPVWDALENDLTRKPPPKIGDSSEDGQPASKKKRKKRIPSAGERNTSKRPRKDSSRS